MRIIPTGLAASAIVLVSLSVAFAQGDAKQGDDPASAMELPEACRTGEAPSMENMQSEIENMGEPRQAFMRGMMQTNEPMMQGMMADDPDVAFACAMIPHHQGAIHMAEVELQYGDSDEMKQMAQKIIEDQTREIQELTQWIEEQAQ